MSVEHSVALADGAFANTVVERTIVEEMYPVWQAQKDTVALIGVPVQGEAVAMTGINSVLRFEEVLEGKVAILGNTVPRLCPIAQDCGNCALAGVGLSAAEMARRNCAKANTASIFEIANIAPDSRYMLTATGDGAYVVSAKTEIVKEVNGGELLFNKLPAAPAVVFTKSWLQAQGMNELMVGINGADGSFGVASMQIQGETVIIPFCSMRDNMGDRGEEKQILRKAINSYLDTLYLSTEERARVVADLHITIELSASAALRNFAHKIRIPREDTDAPQKEKDAAARIRQTYPELIELAGGKITSAIVLESEYPGAFGRGSIFPQFEAEMGIHTSPITPTNCPGDGQTCHIDYRTETQYSLVEQLKQMGVSVENITYNDSNALDPSAPDNNMASNRREQNNGVETNKTNRTVNAMIVRF